MNGRLPQSLLLALLGVTLAPATLRAGTGPCGGAGERACCCSGDGRSCLTQDGCDSDLIEVFVPPCGMTRTPSCGGCSVSWCAKETSCGHDGERACCDIPSCNGSLIEDFTREGKCTGKLGPENCVCGAGAFLSAGICREKKNAGEMCNVFTRNVQVFKRVAARAQNGGVLVQRFLCYAVSVRRSLRGRLRSVPGRPAEAKLRTDTRDRIDANNRRTDPTRDSDLPSTPRV